MKYITYYKFNYKFQNNFILYKDKIFFKYYKLG